MSYSSEVGVTFTKEDWENNIYPHLKSLDGETNPYTGRKADTDFTLSRAEKIENENTISFRWNNYDYWGEDPISKAIEKATDDYASDFARIGESNDDVTVHQELYAEQFDLQCATLRSKDEPYIKQCDQIIARLMQTCMEKGMTEGKLAKALEGVANKDIVKHYADKAREQLKAASKAAGR